MKKDKEQFDAALEQYAEYFKDVTDIYDNLLIKSKNYFDTIDGKISEIAKMPAQARGVNQAMNEYMESAYNMINQQRSLADAKYKVKKQILDNALKDTSGNEGESQDFIAILDEMMKKEKEKAEKHEDELDKFLASNEDLDDQIEKLLQEG